LAYLNVAFAGEVARAVAMINLLISITIARRAAVIAAIAISEKRQTLYIIHNHYGQISA
jgi:hypothetical protein